MSTTEDYIQIMLESLKKKNTILDRIISRNNTQTQCLEKEEFTDVDWDTFNTAMVEKEAEIGRIVEMDEGFQALYDRVSGQLKADKDRYASQIRQMQQLIVELEDKSVKIRTQEERNRQMIEKHMKGRKQKIRQVRKSMSVAASYYKTMQGNRYDGISSLNTKK